MTRLGRGARIQDLGAILQLDRDRHLLATTEGMSDLPNTEAGMHHLVTHLPAPTGAGLPDVAAPHSRGPTTVIYPHA